MTKRFLSLLLVLCLLFTLLPAAMAVDEEETAAEDGLVYLDDDAIASLQEGEDEAAEPAEAAAPEETAQSEEALLPEEAEAPAQVLAAEEETPPEVTRAKWLSDLVAAYELSAEVDDESLPDNYYPDLPEDHEFYHDLLVATHFGLIDVEPGYDLEPDAALTRDFAAFSLNQLTAYSASTTSYAFTDSADVAHPVAAQVALDQGWFALAGGKFLPAQAVTAAEAASMVQAAKDAYAATQIDYSHENKIQFNSGVKVVPQGTVVDEPALGTVTITNCPISIAKGDTIAVYILDIPSIYKVESVSVKGDVTTVTGTPVPLADAASSYDLEGSCTVPLEYAQPLEGSDLYYILGSGSQTKSRMLAKANSVNLSEIKGEKEIPLGNGVKLKVSYRMPAPVLDYSVNPLRPMVILRDSNTVATVTLSKNFVKGMGLPSQVPLVEYRLPGVGNVGVYAYLKLDGSVTLSISGSLKIGVSYASGYLSAPMSFNRKSATITADATVDAGVKAEVSVTLLGEKILHGDIYARIGGAMNFRAVVRDAGVKPHYCVGSKQWLYADAGYHVTVLRKSYNDSITLIDLSAYEVVSHYEDGARVPHCTIDDDFDDYITPPGSIYYNNGGWGGWNGVSYNENWEPIEVYTYELDEDGNATITGFYGNVSALTIPDELDGHTVIAIGDGVFEGLSQVRAVTMPETVKSIGSDAFANCINLSDIEIGSAVTVIGANAFINCYALTTISIPDSVTKIEAAAFANCRSLSNVKLSKGLETMGTFAFYNCDSLYSIEIPKSLTSTYDAYYYDYEYGYVYGVFHSCDNLNNVTFETGATTVANGLFRKCPGLKSITIPDTVTSIGDSAFADDPNLTEVHLGKAVTVIGASAFKDGTGITSIDIPDSVTEIKPGAFGNCTNLSSVKLSKGLEKMGAHAFYNCDALTSIEIPKSLTSTYDAYINEYEYGYVFGPFNSCDNLGNVTFETGTTVVANGLFRKCYGLKSITIPNTVTSIGDGAFTDCIYLENVKLSNSVTVIGGSVFSNCKNLASIEIPNSVREIKPGAFANCSSLTGVKLSKNLEKMGTFAFYNCDALESIEIPKSLTSTYDAYIYEYEYGYVYGPFHSCDGLETATFEAGSTVVANGLFRKCYGLKKVIIPDTVTTIRENAFVDCKNLEEVKIGSSVATIGSCAFQNCSALPKIEIPDSVKTINNHVFQNCTSLESVKLPKDLTEIAECFFDGCSALKKVELPAGVTQIGQYAFRNSGLSEIQWSTALKSIYKYAFENTALTSVTVPNTVKELGEGVFYNNDLLTSIVIPNSVTSMGKSVLKDCDLLKDVTLGSGLKSIPASAFEHCDVLETIVIPYQVTSIGASAFKDCVLFKEITIPRATTSIDKTGFSYPDRLTVYGVAGTTAETFAGEIGAAFVAIDKPLQSITLNAKTLNVNRGSTVQLLPTFSPADFTDEIAWKSSDTSVVTVDSDGNVKAVNVGVATVSIVGGDCKATCKVYVVQPVTSISLNSSSLSLDGGQTYQLTATVRPDNAASKAVKWTSSDESVATVTNKGLVTAVKAGTATITCTASDGSGVSNSCKVTVKSTVYVVTNVADLQSPHKYANNCSDAWQYTQSGQTSLAVTFSDKTSVEEDSDFIYIYDKNGNEVGKYTGTQLAGKTITVPGDTVRIKLVSDNVYSEYGFAVTKVNNVTADGSSVTGWQKKDGKWYYYDASGVMKTGWLKLDGKYYYLNDEGVMQTGWVKTGGKWYYMNSSGVMQTGWQEISGKKYYFASSGAMVTGLQTISGKKYYFDANGVMQTGWKDVSGKRYYFQTDGSAKTGWVKSNGSWYYMDASGAMMTGWVQVNNVWYYFNAKGVMQTGWQKISDKWYYMDELGSRLTGWVYLEPDRYYMDENGVMQTGWVKLDGKWYYFNSSGKMVTGWASIGGKWYYFNADGVMQTGWVKSNSKWYYMNSSGAMATGLQTIGGKQYYFNAKGVMQTGWQEISGKKYYFAASGEMKTGWQKIDSKWYYFNADGVMRTGWLKSGGKWYYMEESGVMHTGWLQLKDKWYYMDSKGVMVTGKQVINGKTRTFDDNGVWLGD